jgi:hypothetical protein
MTTELTLTDEQLMHVCTMALNNWVDGIVETFACFGVDLLDPDGPSVNPRDYALPARQWRAIAECIAGSTSIDKLAKANHTLDWMNLGPSSFEEPDE